MVVEIHFSQSVERSLAERDTIFTTPYACGYALMTDWKEMRTRNTACTCGAQ